MPRDTARRWMDVNDLRIGDILFNDTMAAQGEARAQPIGSNSENNTHANRFLQGVQLAESQVLRTFDLASALSLRNTRLGKGCGIEYTLPSAAEGTNTTDYTVSATSPNCFVEYVSYSAEHDAEVACEIGLIFKTATGTSFSLQFT